MLARGSAAQGEWDGAAEVDGPLIRPGPMAGPDQDQHHFLKETLGINHAKPSTQSSSPPP
ncbi:hypothetical protein COB72_00270 [bacterium]|nr:MAG: hypothetical protein COB72_00270 [bacterium]